MQSTVVECETKMIIWVQEGVTRGIFVCRSRVLSFVLGGHNKFVVWFVDEEVCGCF